MSEHLEVNNPDDSQSAPRPADPRDTRPAPGPHNSWEPVSPAGAPTAGEAAAASGGGQQPPDAYPPSGPAYWRYPPGGGWWAGPAWGPRASPEPSRPPWYVRPIATAALVVATVAAGVGIGHVLWQSSASSPTATSSGSRSGGPSDVSSIAARVDPALVDINVTLDGQEPGAGTGIVLTSDGEVLTNNHVVEGATSISVTDIGNGRTYGATVVGYDATDDVAVIQLTKASGLQAARIGNASGVAVGDAVVAIGNAGGTGGTPTAAGGSITALNQAITASDEVSGTSESLTGLLETDASIQPGDSGGSLVNSSGQVIGMDTAASEGYSLSSRTNQGYAIPINKALSIASEIESGRGPSTVHVGPTAYLGVLVSTSNSSTSPYSGGYYNPFGSQNGNPGTSGAVISGLISGGPAAQAGLAEGDVITSVDGQSVTSASDLSSLMQHYKPGERVRVGYTDSTGATRTATITLGSGPAQ
jgi:S1-C subfamily serine protease